MTLSRRQFIKAGVTSGLLSGILPHVIAAPSNAIFDCGVASGDPTSSSVVIWTHTRKPIPIKWVMATDVSFNHIVYTGNGVTRNESDCTYKVEVTGLEPGKTYFYRFESADSNSEPGRTKTLPVGNLDTLNFAVASCSNYPFGYFNAYHHIALDESIDFVLHLGDYLYEYGQNEWGDDIGRKLNRRHEPSHEIVSLADYRIRHRQYKKESSSRLMHAMHPLIPTWDDHESANNPYMQGAQNHQSNEGDWIARRNASVKAYYEWMPIRNPQNGVPKTSLWRQFSFANLASLTTLETRHSGRSKQVSYGDHLSRLTTADAAKAFETDVLGAPGRSMLSVAMEQFLAEQLKNNNQRATWKLIGNQIPMARTGVPPVDDLVLPSDIDENDPVAAHFDYFLSLGKFSLPIYLDTWDGYPAAREAFYGICKANRTQDLIVLTGDSHAFWANHLFDAEGSAMGIELGTAGITSPGDFESLGPELATELDLRVAQHNPEIVWTDCQHRGYVKVMLSKSTATAQFVSLSSVSSEHYNANVLREYAITKVGNSLEMSLNP